jgi:hypothetical protein
MRKLIIRFFLFKSVIIKKKKILLWVELNGKRNLGIKEIIRSILGGKMDEWNQLKDSLHVREGKLVRKILFKRRWERGEQVKANRKIIGWSQYKNQFSQIQKALVLRSKWNMLINQIFVVVTIKKNDYILLIIFFC